MSWLLFLAFLAAVFAYLLTPAVRRLALWGNVLDQPNERKVHKKPVPLWGGVAIFISFNSVIVLGQLLKPGQEGGRILASWPSLFLCQAVILGLGLWDDVRHLKPGVKFGSQVFVGVLAFVFGFGIRSFVNPFSGSVIELGLLALPVTILWVVGVTNALNLIDGLDGLAAGAAFIGSLTIAGIAVFNANESMAFVSLILAGSLLGFLPHNFYPARIFLGDAGSLLLGFLLAILSVQGSSKGPALIALLAPILALGLPIMDTLLSMIRRLLKSIHVIDYPDGQEGTVALSIKNAGVFRPDHDHVHHRLLKLGLSQRTVVVLLYGVCILLSALALLSIAVKSLPMMPFVVAVLIAFFIGVRSLNYQEFKVLKNGLLIPLLSFPVISRKLFLTFYDLMAIILSAYLSFRLVIGDFREPARGPFLEIFPLLLLIKFGVFYLAGLYGMSFIRAGLEEILKITGVVVLSSLAAALMVALFSRMEVLGGPGFIVLDSYLLLTLVCGPRILSPVLSIYYRKGLSERGTKVLIYGAGDRGSDVLQEIRRRGKFNFSPVGFIDDDPKKKGRTLHGCRILGTSAELDGLLTDHEFSEIIISSAKIAKDKLQRLTAFCNQRKITLRQFEYRFYEFP